MSAGLQTNVLHSSQDFVRALKAASDPPVVGGYSKIEIALEAWNNTSFYVPSKAEIIADWLLTKLLKEKNKEISVNPIFDARYWQLLSSVSKSQDYTSKSNDARPTKSWLTTLLHRIPVGPVVVSFLSSSNDIPANYDLANSITSCLSVLWPVAVQRMNIELLQECFGAFLFNISNRKPSDGMAKIAKTVSASYRNSFMNSSQKKKLYQSFLQTHLKNWLQCLSMDHISADPSLKASIIDTGIETLFNLDILRQNYDSKTEIPLVDRLQGLLTSDRALVLESCPKLLIYYVRAIKQHRGALFSQGSQSQFGASLDELRECGMSSFISVVGLPDDSGQDVQAWRTRAALLNILDNENIFDRNHMACQTSFRRTLELALLVLQNGWKSDIVISSTEDQLECTGLAIQCVSILAHIDYDIIQPFISRLLPLILQIPIASESHFAFLEILLKYHTKTRTMDSLVQAFFSAISAHRSLPGDSREVYQAYSSGPVMHAKHLARVSRALQTFLTESQCLPMIQMAFDTLKDAWNLFYAALRQQGNDDGGPKKKRKTSAAPVFDNGDNADELAVTYSLTARLISVVLSSLPVSSLPSATQDEVRQLLDTFRTDFVRHAISKSTKTIRKCGDLDIWGTEVTLVANLCLLYAMDVSRNLSLPPQHDEKIPKKLLELINDEALLPELTLEVFRLLFYNSSIDRTMDHDNVIDRLLQYLENNFTPSDVHWSGCGHHLTKGEPGRAESALATLHMIAERWLPVIDHFASTKQLERLLNVIISIKLPSVSPHSQTMQPGQLLMGILHSAQFWEFPKIRTVFIDLLDKMTSTLDSSKSKVPKTSSILEKVLIYQHLLFFPMEYFTWQLLNNLIKRALNADIALSREPSSSHKQAIDEALVVIRVFLKRAYIYSGSVAQDSNNELSQFLIHLLKNSASFDTNSNGDFTRATLDLVEIYFSNLLKASKKSGPGPVLEVLATYTSDLFINAPATLSCSFIMLVNLLTREFPQNSLPDDISATLRKLHQKNSSSLLPWITSVTESDMIQDTRTNVGLVSGWHSLLCLDKWLESPQALDIPLIGQKLTSKLITALVSDLHVQGDYSDELCITAFAILLQELDARPAQQRSSQLDLIVAIYISFSSILSQTCRKAMDLHLGKACKGFALEDYVYMLSLAADSLSDLKHLPSDQLLHLVHFAGLLLREHPSHSLSHIQKFTTSCINVFTENSVFVDGPLKLRLQVLGMVAQHCSDQPAALRSLDMAGVWLLLSKFLAPSEGHDEDSETIVFHKIVAILSSLIRLRRDLVTHGLPHLGMILRRLLLCMRGCRPQLGARQTAIIMHTHPKWINATHALGAEEAKILGRLLESLNTKTTVRAFASTLTSLTSPEAQKAESLAKPFSKHAAYVLKAYIEAMNDPLCVMPLDVRKELQPGIFALCSMVTEHSRDSLMVSALDAGGKAILKNLWKDYDKQRYVGRG